MNNRRIFSCKAFLTFVFILPCFLTLFISHQVNADEDCVIEGSVYTSLGYSISNSSIDLYVDVYPDGSLSRNDSCFDHNSQLRSTLSSSWNSSKDYYLGYRIASSWTLQDQRTHYNTYKKSISKSSFKSGASYRESGNWGYWSKKYCVHNHIYWSPTGESMVPGDIDICKTITISERLTRTLTVKAIDTSGRSLSSLMPDKRTTVKKGLPASATVSGINGYSKVKWGTSTSSSTWWNDTGMTYTVNPLNDDVTVYAVYQFNEYQGASQVSEVDGNWNSIASNKKKSTGWTKTSKKVTHFINNCDPINGCTAKFWHNLKRTAGLSSTTFSITRTSNYYTISSGTMISTRTENFSSGSEINERTVAYVNKLFPGQVVCETLTFNSDLNTRNVTTTACAAALGNAQPPDSSDNAFLDIKVSNQSVTAFNNFQKEVYAKPGDKVTYQATYNPVLQYTYRLYPQKIQIDSGVLYPSGNTINSSLTLQQLFNNRYSGPHWKNAFSIQQSKDNFSSASLISNNTYAIGSTTKRVVSNNYRNGSSREEISTDDVGVSIGQKALTNLNSTTKTTPSQVTFYQNNDLDVGNVITATKSSTAYAYIPYNFINTTTVTSNDSNTTFYAGESAAVDFKINTETKRNNVTDGTYATVVNSAKWKLLYCVGQANCDRENYTYETNPDANIQTNPTTGKLNPNGKMTGDTTSKSITINIPDVAAGTQICVRSAVWPANSGSDRNWQDKEGSHTWATSDTRECFIVAKKPSLEVWGGNVYSQGKINTATATKGHLDGYSATYDPETKYSTKYVFGSWAESGIITTGTITGLTSGASLGYAANYSGNLAPNPFNGFYNTRSNTGSNPGGSTSELSTFTLNPLTFANYPTIGTIGNSVSTNGTNADKNSIISRLIYGGEVNVDVNSPVSLNNTDNIKQDNIYYYYGGNNNLTIPGSTIDANTLQIVHSNHNINISGDLVYGGSYSDFNQMPKLVIYANNVTIDCDVTRIDALIMASNNVVTCNNFDNDFNHLGEKVKEHINDYANSTQLTVNGAIIANRLVPNRTYGAATGANSMIPAEIINYDPTLYLWGNSRTETGEKNRNLDVSYQKELPPRR